MVFEELYRLSIVALLVPCHSYTFTGLFSCKQMLSLQLRDLTILLFLIEVYLIYSVNFCCTIVIQLYTYKRPFCIFFSLMVYHKLLNIVPCAIQ